MAAFREIDLSLLSNDFISFFQPITRWMVLLLRVWNKSLLSLLILWNDWHCALYGKWLQITLDMSFDVPLIKEWMEETKCGPEKQNNANSWKKTTNIKHSVMITEIQLKNFS